MRRTIASIGLGSSFFAFNSQPSLAINTDASTAAAGNVLRVSYSLKLIDKSIETVGDVKLVVSQIDKLMQNCLSIYFLFLCRELLRAYLISECRDI